MVKKFYSEAEDGTGYVLLYLTENYSKDMQQVLQLRKEIKKDFPEVKDYQILVQEVGRNESNLHAGFMSARFKVENMKNLGDEFTMFFTRIKVNYPIVDETAEVKRYWSQIIGIDDYVIRYAMADCYRTDMAYLLALLDAVKKDYPEVKEREIDIERIEYWYSEKLAEVTVLEFKSPKVDFSKIEEFPINDEPDC